MKSKLRGKKGSFHQMLADGASAQNSVVGSVTENHVVSVPATNLNIGMDLWNASAARNGSLKVRQNPSAAHTLQLIICTTNRFKVSPELETGNSVPKPMSCASQKNEPWLSVPQFGDWDLEGQVPDYSMDFSKIREMRKQNKRDVSRSSLGNEEELVSSTTRPNAGQPVHHNYTQDHSPTRLP